jgi:LPXTG-site transpeptidase (sortase) family protein
MDIRGEQLVVRGMEPEPEILGPLHGWQAIKLAILAALVLAQVGCGPPQTNNTESTTDSQLNTPGPDMVLTLTAWPTLAPVITRPPTPTAIPVALWTAEPEASPTVSIQPTATSVLPADEPGVAWRGAALGTLAAPKQILIPALELDAPVESVAWEPVQIEGQWVSEWQTAENAVGHHRNSANPGELGNVVLSGHHNTRGEVFRQLGEIGQPGSRIDRGDTIVLVSEDDTRYEYVIVDWYRFLEEGIGSEEKRAHAQYMEPSDDARLTLVTCWPYDSNSHRVVVVAQPAP